MDNIKQYFGKHLQSLRKMHKMTQLQLAEKAGLSLKHLGEIERGRGNPTLDTLNDFAKAFDISLSDLFDMENEDLSSAEVETKLHNMIEKAPIADKIVIYKVINALRK